MTTEPGDLVLDPTSGSGTTAYVAEQWGRLSDDYVTRLDFSHRLAPPGVPDPAQR